MQSSSVALARSQRNTQDHARIAEESSAVLQAAREGRLHQPSPSTAPLARYGLAQAPVEERKEPDDDARARPAVLEPYRGDAGRMPNVQARLAGPVPEYNRLIERLGTGSSQRTRQAGMSIDRSGSPQRSARLVLEESSRAKPAAAAAAVPVVSAAPSASADEPLYRACQVLNRASALLAEKEHRVQVAAGAITAAMQAQRQPPATVAPIDDQELSNARFAPPLRQPKASLPSSSLAMTSTGKPSAALSRPKIATPAEYLKTYSQSTSPLSQPASIGSESTTVPLQAPSAPPAPPKVAKSPTPPTPPSTGGGASTGGGGCGGSRGAPPAPPTSSQGAQLLGGDRSVKAGNIVPMKPPSVSSATPLMPGHVRPEEAPQPQKLPAGSLGREGEVEGRAASAKPSSASAQVQAAGYELQLAVQELLNLVQLTEKVLSDPRLSVAPASIVAPIQAACDAARLEAKHALELVGPA